MLSVFIPCLFIDYFNSEIKNYFVHSKRVSIFYFFFFKLQNHSTDWHRWWAYDAISSKGWTTHLRLFDSSKESTTYRRLPWKCRFTTRMSSKYRCRCLCGIVSSSQFTLSFIFIYSLFSWFFIFILQDRALVSRNRNEFAVQHIRLYETKDYHFYNTKFWLQHFIWCCEISKRISTWWSQIRMVTRTVSWLVCQLIYAFSLSYFPN